MDTLLKDLLAHFSNRTQTVIAIVVCCLVGVPYLFRIWNSWLDTRSSKRRLDEERARLEILKIRYEIEGFRKIHNLPELEPVVGILHDPKVGKLSGGDLTGESLAGQWRWLHWVASRRPTGAKIIVYALLIFTWLYVVGCTIDAIVMPMASFSDPEREMPIWARLLLAVVFALCALGMFKLARSLSRQLNLLRKPPKRV